MAVVQRQWPPLLVLLVYIILTTTHCNKVNDTIVTTTTLSNGEKLPLVGIGVGNLQHGKIVELVAQAAQQYNVRLVDTAHASHNHHLVKQGIEESSITETMHVVTKVWYTYLGYERTMLAVKEILKELDSTKIKVDILLHWPRCRDDIPWMDCEGEEKRLPQAIKNAGPPPHLDKDGAYIESWRALEDLYKQHDTIASIGVSNFDLQDFQTLMASSRITPHLLQGNVWTYVFDPHLMQFLKKHDIHFQAYNVVNGVLSQTSRAPNAYQSLLTIAQDVSASSPAQVVLGWLIANDVSVIPRTSSLQHLQENAASVEIAPLLTPKLQATIQNAVAALLRGVDLDPPTITFHNTANQVAHVYWIHSITGEHVLVKQDLQPRESFVSTTYPGHSFVAMDESKSSRHDFTVSASYGDAEEFHIEL